MECLQDIIGLSQSDCDCFELSDAAKISASGLYMDDLAEFPIKLSTLSGGSELCETLEGKMMKSRDSAKQIFKEELFKMISLRYSQSVQPYSGYVGSTSWSKTLNPGKQYAGVLISPKQMGAKLIIKQIDTYMAQTASFNVLIYQDDILLHTIPVHSTADTRRVNVFEPAIELPFLNEYGAAHTYKIVYEVNGVFPKDNAIRCGCGNESKIDAFFARQGISGNTIENMTTSPYAHGLILVAIAQCGTDDIICDLYNKNEFAKTVIAASIRRKSVELLIADLLAGKAINRDTMVNREQMGINGAKLHNKFKNDIQWLSEQVDLSSNGCFVCGRSGQTISVGGIRL